MHLQFDLNLPQQSGLYTFCLNSIICENMTTWEYTYMNRWEVYHHLFLSLCVREFMLKMKKKKVKRHKFNIFYILSFDSGVCKLNAQPI